MQSFKSLPGKLKQFPGYLVVCLEKELFRCEEKTNISHDKANLKTFSSERKKSPQEWGEKTRFTF